MFLFNFVAGYKLFSMNSFYQNDVYSSVFAFLLQSLFSTLASVQSDIFYTVPELHFLAS